jgi:hypothetical protein
LAARSAAARIAAILGLLGAIAIHGPAAAAERALSVVTDWDGESITAVEWRPGSGRVRGQWRQGDLERAYLFLPGRGYLEGWGGGLMAIRFGSGATGFAADPARRLGLAPASGAGLAGGALLLRAGTRRFLAAAGADAGRPALVIGLDEPRAGVVYRIDRGGRSRLAAAARCGWGRRQVVIDGRVFPAPACALELRTLTGLGESALTLRLPDGAVGATGWPGSGYSPRLELVLRRAHGAIAATLGVHAELRAAARALAGEDLERARRLRAFGETAIGISPEMQGRLRAEWRGGGEEGHARLHGEWRGPFARAAVDWTTGGGILMQVRARWTLAGSVTLEAGSATWSGPLVDRGATVDLPAVPSQALSPRFGRAGHQTGALIDWQRRPIRVRLGWTIRQHPYGALDGRFSSRLELTWWRERAGTGG